MNDWMKLTPESWAAFEAEAFAEAFAEVEDQIADLDPTDREMVLAEVRRVMARQSDINAGAVARALGTAH